MDVAIVFPGIEIIQDRYKQKSSIDIFIDYIYRYSQGDIIPSLDIQQDFCLIQMNCTNQNVYIVFERFITTEDNYDINLISNLYLTFSMGIYSLSNETNNFNLENPFFHKSFNSSINLMNCLSSKQIFTGKKNFIEF